MDNGKFGIGMDNMITRKGRPRPAQHRAAPADRAAFSPPATRPQTREAFWSSFTNTLFFARNFLRYPNLVGWMLPSSPFVVAQVLRQIDWSRARVIVEYGPGVGTFTKEILRRMRPDARLLALEVNSDFVRLLRAALPDARLQLVHGSAADVDIELARLGYSAADYVISGLPFKTLPGELCHVVTSKTHAVLRPKGAFLVYQLSGAALPYLQRVFGKVDRDFQWLSIMPARLFYCIR
jgi:phospholipid N-methyltransferase